MASRSSSMLRWEIPQGWTRCQAKTAQPRIDVLKKATGIDLSLPHRVVLGDQGTYFIEQEKQDD
jgi:hypothetical protein